MNRSQCSLITQLLGTLTTAASTCCRNDSDENEDQVLWSSVYAAKLFVQYCSMGNKYFWLHSFQGYLRYPEFNRKRQPGCWISGLEEVCATCLNTIALMLGAKLSVRTPVSEVREGIKACNDEQNPDLSTTVGHLKPLSTAFSFTPVSVQLPRLCCSGYLYLFFAND